MSVIADIVNYVQSVPGEVWAAIGTMIGISAILQKIKTWFSLQSDKVITFVLSVLSFVPVVIDYINSQIAANPAVIAPRTLAIMGGATAAYRYIIKPATRLLQDAKIERERRLREQVPQTTESTVAQSFDV